MVLNSYLFLLATILHRCSQGKGREGDHPFTYRSFGKKATFHACCQKPISERGDHRGNTYQVRKRVNFWLSRLFTMDYAHGTHSPFLITASHLAWWIGTYRLGRGYRRRRRITICARGCLHAINAERLTNSHIRCRDDAAFRHQHRGIVAHCLHLTQAKSFKRNQGFHTLVPWKYQDFDRIEGNPIISQELLQVLEHNLRKVMDFFIDRFKRRDLY